MFENNKAGTQSGHNYSDSDMDTEGFGKQDIGELQEAFRQYMLSAGMPSVPDSIEITGNKIPRWKDTSKQSGNKDCWYRFGINSDGSVFGKFGNHKGIEGKWHSIYDKGLPAIKLSQKEKEQLAALKAESEKAESALREEKRKEAYALFETGSLVCSLKERHWYIQEKKIKTFEGLKQERNTLLIPCYSANAELLAVQRIYKDNTQGKKEKRFLGSYSGGFFIIGNIKPDGICYLTEGYATGATVYEARGAPVIVAFSSGNLLAVAKIILNLYPKIKLIIAADNDLRTLAEKGFNPGKEAAEKVSRELDLQIALSPVNSDFNDFYIENGCNMEVVKEALKKTYKAPKKTKPENQKETKQTASDTLLEIANDFTLYNDGDSCFADIIKDDHRETYLINSSSFRGILSYKFYQRKGKAPHNQALQDALRTIEGKAKFEGEKHRVFMRLGIHKGAIFLDLGSQDRSAVKITKNSWEVVNIPDCRFKRPNGLQELPIPKKNGDILKIKEILNVKSDRDIKLIIGWLLAALKPDIPNPILVVTGEQGSGKSTASEFLKRVIDPNISNLRTPPKNEMDLVLAANNGLVVALNNISKIPDWLSDALCRVSTGGGLGKRQLFTDSDEILIYVQRPLILNGIENFLKRSDLADRTIKIELDHIDSTERNTEIAIKEKFNEIHPEILGGVMDAMVSGLKHFPTIEVDRLPRMADAAKWWCACEIDGLSWESGEILQAFNPTTQLNV